MLRSHFRLTLVTVFLDMDVFVRTPVWFVQISDNFGNNHECIIRPLSVHVQIKLAI
jgi:hypothetical protein